MVFGKRLEESVAFAMPPTNYVLSKMLEAARKNTKATVSCVGLTSHSGGAILLATKSLETG